MEREKLIQARTRRHWTQMEAAEYIGVDYNTLYRWERGLTAPRGHNLRQLCHVYETTATALGLAQHPQEPIAQDDLAISPMVEEAHAFLNSDLTMRLLTLAFTHYRNLRELQDTLATIIEEHTMQTSDNDHISRRNALCRLALLPLLTLKLNNSQPVLSHPVEDTLTQCAASIVACWELSNSSQAADLTLAFKSVSAYVPTLKAIVKDSVREQHREAANLTAQCSFLQTLLSWHFGNLKDAALYAQDGVSYAKETGDIPQLVIALDYQAWVLYYSNRSKQAQNALEQALSVLKTSKTPVPSRLLSDIYSGVAVMQTKNGQQATVPLRLAAEAFFGEPGKEEHQFVYMDYTEGNLILNNGMALYQQGDYDAALDSLEQLIDLETLTLKIALSERSRIEGLNIMALASLKNPKKDMERTLHFWKPAIQGATTLQSEQRFTESLLGYEIMRSVWPDDKRVIELRDLTGHW